jgi:hypothetical protein
MSFLTFRATRGLHWNLRGLGSLVAFGGEPIVMSMLRWRLGWIAITKSSGARKPRGLRGELIVIDLRRFYLVSISA